MKKLVTAAAVLVALTSSALAAGAQRPIPYADNPELIGQHHTSGHIKPGSNPVGNPAVANTDDGQRSAIYANNPDLVGQSHSSSHIKPGSAVVR